MARAVLCISHTVYRYVDNQRGTLQQFYLVEIRSHETHLSNYQTIQTG